MKRRGFAWIIKRLPDDVYDALYTLSRYGEAYIVGGAVRDFLLGRRPKDYDITTELRPNEVIEVFESVGWKVVPKGIDYGVVSVIHPVTRREIEVATFRREFYAGRGHAVTVVFTDKVEEDLARRDFTINAMAVDINGVLVDPFNGLSDVKRKVLRFVGDPEKRIREDPLRMLRAVRISAELGFKVDKAAKEAISKNVHYLLAVSRERWGQEIIKAAESTGFSRFIVNIYATGLHTLLLPELDDLARVRHDNRGHHRGETVLEHTLEALTRADALHRRLGPAWPGPHLKLAALLHDIGKPDTYRTSILGKVTFNNHEVVGARKAREILLYRWRLPGSIAKKVEAIIRYHTVPLQAPQDTLGDLLVARYGEVSYDLAIHAYLDTGDKYYLRVARSVLQKLKKPKPLLNGYDIMLIYNMAPGPWVGAAKEILYMIQLRYNIRSKKQLVIEACRLGILCADKETKIMKLLKASPDKALELTAKIITEKRSRNNGVSVPA